MTIRRFVLFLTIVGIIGGSSPALAEDFDSQAQDHDSCIVDLTGDVNLSGSITSVDIIIIINDIFLRRGAPHIEPCSGAADVTCNGSVTTADVILLINYIFKSGPVPCDICMSEEAFDQNCIQ